MKNFELALPALLCFVKESCHENLHETMNELRDLTHDKDLKPLKPVATFVEEFIRRVQFHLAAEENELFPLIENDKKETNVYPIHHLMDDHDEFNKDLLILRSMTNNFEVRSDLNDKSRYFYLRLLELERIIMNHIRLENYVLFPMVINCS